MVSAGLETLTVIAATPD